MTDQIKIGAITLTKAPGAKPADPLYQPDPADVEAVALAIDRDLPVLIVGPTGCGKTSLVHHMASLVGSQIVRINMTGDYRTANFVGQFVLSAQYSQSGQSEVVWDDGPLLKAMRSGAWLLVDEIDACPPGVMLAMQSVLEPSRTITLPNGEAVKAHKDFRIFATANSIGTDDMGLYTGTMPMNEATLDRFAVTIQMAYPLPKVERQILRDRTGIGALHAKGMVEVAGLIRAACDVATVACTLSTRRLVNWADLAVQLGGGEATADSLRLALRLAVTNRVSMQDDRYICDVVQRVLGVASIPRQAAKVAK